MQGIFGLTCRVVVTVDPPQDRRIKAARALAGFKSTATLAKAIGGHGLSDKTLRKIESPTDGRVAETHELEKIATACKLPLAFFTEDLAALEDVRKRRIAHEKLSADPELDALSRAVREGLQAVEGQVGEEVRRRFDELTKREAGELAPDRYDGPPAEGPAPDEPDVPGEQTGAGGR